MSQDSIHQLLQESLADFRFTRKEKRSLKEAIAQFAGDGHRLARMRSDAFEMVRNSMTDAKASKLLDWLEAVTKALTPSQTDSGASTSEAYFSPGDQCVNRIVRLFDSARQSADVCVYTITDNRIRDAILEAHRRKITIRIISDNEKSNDLGSDIHDLAQRGLNVRIDRSQYHMHHKFAIFDDRHLLTGSYNWTRSAAQHNEENFIVTSDRNLVLPFRQSFEELWQQLG